MSSRSACSDRSVVPLGSKLRPALRIATLGSTLMLLCLTCASAQDRRLHGLDSVTIKVEELADKTKVCGIRTSPLESALRIAFSRSKIKVLTPKGSGASEDLFMSMLAPNVYVEVMTMPAAPNLCTASMRLEVNNRVYFDMRGEIGSQGLATVWSVATLLNGPPGLLSQRLNDTLDAWVVDFLVDWSKAN